MIGTFVNIAAILAGAVVGLRRRGDLSPARQDLIKKILGIFTVWIGLSQTWAGLHGGFWSALRQVLFVILAMALGRLAGRFLGLQHAFNRLGQYAKRQFARAVPGARSSLSEGFVTCAVLFCATPLAVLGSLHEGLWGAYKTLLIKSCMDGLATIAFARAFGAGVMLSAVPVLACQGTITLVAQALEPFLREQALLDSVGAAAGMLIFAVALVILEIRKVALADYLPSLVFAPLLAWLWALWSR